MKNLLIGCIAHRKPRGSYPKEVVGLVMETMVDHSGERNGRGPSLVLVVADGDGHLHYLQAEDTVVEPTEKEDD